MRAYVVDDDPVLLELLTGRLSDAGHQVTSFRSGARALESVFADKPDFILMDIMMPDCDGLDFCRKVRADTALSGTPIVVVTAKAYDFDRRQAAAAGANGYITKPIGPDFMRQIDSLLIPSAKLRYWGVRGTLPRPGPESLRYGGNTSCVSMSFGADRHFIFDAGTGIHALGSYLMARRERVTAHIFISHPHWDHINAFPFFGPLYMPGNAFQVMGATHGDMSIRQIVGDQMDSVHFPVTMREFAAQLEFHDIGETTMQIGDVTVRTLLLSHPGRCLGYRLEWGGRSLCYVTDNELFPLDLPQHDSHYENRLTAFVAEADVLITDTTYTDTEYRRKIGWGHSAVGEVVRIAHAAEVKELHLFHHDPDQGDDDIDRKLEAARAQLNALGSATRCIAPAEGDVYKMRLAPSSEHVESRVA